MKITLLIKNIGSKPGLISLVGYIPQPGPAFKKKRPLTLPLLKPVVFALKFLLLLTVPFILTSAKVYAQETISYTPSTNVYSVGTTITPLSPAVGPSPADSYTIDITLPAGLSFDTTTGTISGTPTAVSATTTYTVTAISAANGNGTTTVTLTVNPAAPSITYTTPNTFVYGTAITPLSPSNSGGSPDSYSISPSLPSGLSFDTATGVISGTPAAIAAATDYNVTATNVTGSSTFAVNITVNKAVLTISGASANNKTYDGTTTAVITGTLSGVISGDAVTLDGTGSFASPNVGTGIAVTSTSTLSGADAGNYTLTQPTGLTANITAKTLTVNGAAGVNKTYDQTTAATITGTLNGVIAADAGNVTLVGTGTFATQNVGTGIAITSTSTLSGSAAGNYTLTQPTGLTANITAKALTVSPVAANNKVYDGTTSATITGTLVGVISGDAVTFNGTGTFASPNVGTGIAVTSTSTLSGAQAGNYTLTQPTGLTANITSATLTITGMTANNKVYDGTTTASFTGGTLNGVQPGDVVTFTPSGTFATANVGTGIAVTSTTTLGGANAGNYTLTQPTGLSANITAKAITITGAVAANKTYDATTAATISGTLNGVLASDAANVTLVGTGTFATANVGTGIAVTSTSTLSGTAAGNYTLTQPTGLTANITAVTLTITGLTTNPASGVTYTGSTAAPLKGTGSLVGVLAADAGKVTLVGTPTGTFPSANVGSYSITITGYSLGGTASGNYVLASPLTITGKITAMTLTITPTPLSKVYGTTEPASVTGQTTFTASGLQNGETIGTVTINYGVQAQNIREQVGTYSTNANYSITASAAAGGTFNPSNYNISYPTGTFTVIPAPFYWVGATSSNWRTTGNWYSAGLQQDYNYPGKTNSADVVYVGVSGGPSGTPSALVTPTLVLDSSLTVASFTFGNSGSSTINLNPNTGITLATSGGFTINSGTLTVNMVTNNPKLTIGGNYTASGSGNTFNISSSNAFTITGTTTNAGTFNQSGTGTVTMTGAITNTGTINQTSTGAMVFTGDFTNSGSTSAFKQTGSGTATFSGALTNGGTFTQGSGAITVVGTLTNSTAGTLTLGSANFTMSSGDYINTGTFTAGTGMVYFTNSLGNQKLYGGTGTGTVFNNVTFTATSGPVKLMTGVFGISSTGIMTLAGSSTALNVNSTASLTIYSTAASSGTVAAIPTGCSMTGNVTVQRYMSAVRGYRLMSSPVYAGNDGTNNYYGLSYLETNCYLTGDGGGWDKAGNPTLYLYRENLVPAYSTFFNSNFRGVANITNSAAILMDDATYPSIDIPQGDGYLFYYRGSRNQMTLAAATTPGATATTDTLNAVGTLIQGNVTVHDWYTPSSGNLGYTTVSGTPTIEGFNLVGNPYASSIDWDNFSSTSSSAAIYGPNVSKYSYQLVLSGQGAGNYNVYGAGSASKTGTQGRPNSNIIVSGEGFFVQATNASASLTFKEAAKTNTQVTGTSLYMSSKHLALNNSDQYLRLQFAKDSINTDGILIRFNSDAAPTYNPLEDAIYRVGLGKVSLSSLSSDNVPLAINQLPLLNGESIRLKIGATVSGNYALKLAEIEGVPQLFDIWLIDSMTKDSVNLRNNNTYNLAITTTDTATVGSNRLRLTIRENPALAYKLLSFKGEKISKRAVQLTWTTQNEQNYTNFTVERSTDNGKTYEIVGSVASTGAGAYSLVDPDPAKGYNLYRLKSEDFNNTISYSNVVNEQFQDNGNDKSSHLSLFPNPAVNTINLTIVPQSQGNTTYNIRISNSTGLVVKNATTSDVSWQNDVSGLLTGTYLIEVVDKKDNSVIGQTKFIKL